MAVTSTMRRSVVLFVLYFFSNDIQICQAVVPSSQPTRQPTGQPTRQPTGHPSKQYPIVLIPLGGCEDFAVQAGTAVSFDGVQTTLFTGSVGVAPGTSITGNYQLESGTEQLNTVAAIKCRADLNIAYYAAANASCTGAKILQSNDLAGLTLLPGVYCSASGQFSFSAGTVTLNAKGDADAQWVFQTSTSLTTATATSFILQNGALEENVYWAIGSSATIGYSSNFVGTILAQVSVTFGYSSVIVGRGLAMAAVSFESGSRMTLPTSSATISFAPTSQPTSQPSQPTGQPSRQPTSKPSAQPSRQPTAQPSRQPTSKPSRQPTAQPTAQPSRQPSSQPTSKPSTYFKPSATPTKVRPTSQPTGQPTAQPSTQPSSNPTSEYYVVIYLGVCADFTVQAGTAVSFNGVQTTVFTGSVGVAPGTSISGNYALVSGVEEKNSLNAIQCTADLKIAYLAASGATCMPNNILQSADLAGRTLLPGVYCSASGSFILSASTLTLDAKGDSNAQWIFQTSTSLSTATATSFILQNGAQAKNVYWAIGSSATIGYSSNFIGTILAQVSVTFGYSSVIVGRGLAMAAVTFESGSKITLPSSPSFPSLAPTARTRSPTKVPTFSPTFVAASPTPVPTVGTVVSIQFSQSITGIASYEAGTETFKVAMQSTIADSIDVPTTYVSINQITSTARRSLLQTTGVNVMYTVSVPNGNTTALTSLVNNAVSDGSLTNSLQRSGYQSAAASTPPTVVDTSPTPSPSGNSRKTGQALASDSIIIGCTIGAFFFVVFVVAGIFYFLCRSKQQSPLPYDGADFGTLETSQTAKLDHI
jgi:hypothetical protein